MKNLFEQLIKKKIIYSKHGVLCGYSDSHFIIATTEKDNIAAFRRLEKDMFILEEYRDPKYKYIYSSEKGLSKKK